MRFVRLIYKTKEQKNIEVLVLHKWHTPDFDLML